MENEAKIQYQTEQQMNELNEQFAAFLRTKGIKSKFRLAFDNMEKSAKKQHASDVAEFEKVKAESVENNKEFAEFLCTKGIKAKYKLVVENIKKGAKNAASDTDERIARIKAETRASVARAGDCGKTSCTATMNISASELENEFNAFLKSKGLDGKYTVSVIEE